MSVVMLSVEEIVQTLSRSALPTILVEGRDDMRVYGWLESVDPQLTANVMQCGGRESLLQVFARRREFPSTPCVFVADMDMWTFSGRPAEYEGLVLTTGYSIENDVLAGSCVHRLFSSVESQEFDSLSLDLARWFAFEVEECRAGRDCCVDKHPNRVVPLGSHAFDERCVAPRVFREPDATLAQQIYKDFELLFRGKCLLALYVRILHAPERLSRLNGANILEISAKLDSTKHTQRLGRAVKRALA